MRYLLTFLFTFLLIFPVHPQEVKKTGGFARISGMGNNPFIVDPYFMTVNPAWGAYYDNFLFGDLGSGGAGTGTDADFGAGGTGQFIAANFGLGSSLTLGAFLSRNDFNGFSIAALDPLSKLGGIPGAPNLGVVSILNGLGIPLNAVPLNNNVELFGTLEIGKMALGFGVAYTSTTKEQNAAGTQAQGGGTTTAAAHQLGFNGGLLINFSNSLRLDGGVSFMLPSATFTPVQGNETSVSESIIMVNARLFSKFSSKVTLVPTFSFITTSGTQDEGFLIGDSTHSTDLPSLTAFNVGLGVDYAVGDFLLAGGLSLANLSL
ncbi:MAG TPA: hypothetical protein VMT35_07055, partial [Ignavibacteriaceae bacterium]|nr:hypothetical protein [Ignavibacteriaceae bacterium]